MAGLLLTYFLCPAPAGLFWSMSDLKHVRRQKIFEHVEGGARRIQSLGRSMQTFVRLYSVILILS